MNSHGKSVLEYQLVLATCRSFSIVDAPFRGMEELPFFHNVDELGNELRLLGIFKQIMAKKGHGLAEVPLIDDIIPQLTKEGVILELANFTSLTLFVWAYSAARRWLHEQSEDYDDADTSLLGKFIASWADPRDIMRIIQPYFDAQGVFREEEIPELRSIIRHIQTIHGQLQDIARSFLGHDRDAWSSNESAQRDGRVVLALKSDYRGRVEGLLHGYSGSGQTIYIEPPQLLEKNNALADAKNEYHLAIHRILKKCSNDLRPFVAELAADQQQFSRFNSLQARAGYSLAIGGNPAQHSLAGIHLMQARHPALGKNAVPVTISMEVPTRIIVLSGPNTGGKTVGMKTLGLLALMNQSGMEIPAAPNSYLPLFSDIMVDIGDEQSIDAGLSTFSAHLQNLGEVLAAAQDRALILLDELGGGTNPTEGAAIAMAIMEVLATSDVYAMVTTHHDSLKAYAFKHPNMENAAVAFSDNRPDYTIVPGLPGESHALDIAERVGMNPNLVMRARALLDDKGFRIQGLIEDLRELKTTMQQQQEEYQQKQRELAAKGSELLEREHLLHQRELVLKAEGLLEHRSFMAESRKKIEALLQELNLQKQLSAEERSRLNRGAKEALKELATKEAAARAELVRAEERERPLPASFAAGMWVHYRGRPAEISEAGRRPGSWVILAGSLRITVAEKDMEAIAPPAPAQDNKIPVEYSREVTPATSITLDIRGMRAQESLKALERFLDQACLSGLKFFSVIHGKGTGVLQQLAHSFLNEQHQVDNVCFAPPDDGGAGKSYVYLK